MNNQFRLSQISVLARYEATQRAPGLDCFTLRVRNDDVNEEVKKYRNLLAQRAGRHSKDTAPEDGEE